MTLHIGVLGHFRARAAGRDVPGLAAQPARCAVLACLAVAEEVTRDRLICRLWPDRSEVRARHALSQVLHKLRRDLGTDWLEANGTALRLAGTVTVDAREFEQAVQLGDSEAALRLYRGPFLEDWAPHCTHEFELWLDTQRGRFAGLHSCACRELARQRERAGELDGAVAALLRCADSAPFDERAHQDLFELLLRCGRTGEAVGRHREFLARHADAGVETTPELSRHIGELLRASARARIAPGMHDHPTGKTGPGAAAPSVSAPLRERVLVVPFENLTGDARLDTLGRLTADCIGDGLDRAGIGRIIPLADALRLINAAGSTGEMPGSTGDADNTLARMRALGQALGAGTLITGSFYPVADALEFRAQAVDLESGELLGSIEPVRTAGSRETDQLPLVRERVLGLMASVLDVEWAGLPNSPDFGLPPPTYAAYRAYAAGLDHFVRLDFARAIPCFERARSLDPNIHYPILLEAGSHLNLGEWEAVAALIAALHEKRDRLSPYELSGLHWYQATLAGDLNGAFEESRRARQRYPGTIAHFLSALDALQVNRPRDAIRALLEMEPGRGWLLHFHAFWDVLTSAYHVLGDHRAELAAAARARAHAPALLAHLAYEVRALVPAGPTAALDDRLAEAGDLPPQPGWSAGRIMLLAAAELRAHGHRAAATVVAERAANWYRQDAELSPFTAFARGEQARALCLAERWAEAGRIYSELAPEFPQNVEYRGRLAMLAARRGDAAGAALGDEELRQLARPFLFGRETAWRARVAAQLGDADRAVRLLVRAFAEGYPHGVELHADQDLEPLRDHEVFQRLLRPRG
jgi:DNA-binding SARP family transcriptional activator/TolB-like protein